MVVLEKCAVAVAILAQIYGQAAAEESLNELTHRGLTSRGLQDVDALQLDSLEVSIGLQSSSLAYKIFNPTTAPVTATLTLPLPDLDFSDPDASWAIPSGDPVNFVSLTAKQDKKPTSLSFTQTANLDGKDVTATLKHAGLSLVPVGAFHNQLLATTAEARQRLTKEGLIAPVGTDQAGTPLYAPRWLVKTAGIHDVTLAPGQSVVLEYRFRTSVGVSPDTVLREPLRSNKALGREVERHRADYCVDHAFDGGVDKIVATKAEQRSPQSPGVLFGPDETPPSATPQPSIPPVPPSAEPSKTAVKRIFPEANIANLREMRISFDLESNAFGGRARQFHLTVDKGRPTWLVSFCLDNLKKTSATGFETRATDYRPAVPIKILLVGPKD